MTPITPNPGQPDPLDNIQGNLIGFNKDHQRFIFVQFPDAVGGKGLLADLASSIARASEVLEFNDLFKKVQDRGADAGTVEATWTNIALTGPGLEILGAPDRERMPEEFRQGMAAAAARIGDVEDSAPTTWVAPFNNPALIHAVVLIAADDPDDLEACYAGLQAKLQARNVHELGHFDGATRPGANRGHEHFGFKDGISQPGIAGLTKSSKGRDEIATGEFVIGYPDQDGNVSGTTPAPAPQPGQPGYGPNNPPPPAAGLPEWAKDGSFYVFRRLRQNVQGFNDFLSQQAAAVGLSPDQLGTKLVGRWKSGAPLERTRTQDPNFDPTAVDPSIADPSILSDEHINDFDYEPQDADGHLVPRAAHIRKTNPRSEDPPTEAVSNRHRILRRGAPYGPDFSPGEPAYPGSGSPPDNQDRGLLFACYQASILAGFEFIQQSWANTPGFPQADDGRDPIISQDVNNPDFHLPPHDPHLVTQRWVITTGGEYFFSPSISTLHLFATS